MISFNLDPAQVIGLLVAVVLPIVVGLVTTSKVNGGWKAAILAFLAALTGLLTEVGTALQTHSPYNLGQGVLFALGAFMVATAMHFGLYKPTNVSEKAQALFTRNTITVEESPITRTPNPYRSGVGGSATLENRDEIPSPPMDTKDGR